jgi:hypothetical protein
MKPIGITIAKQWKLLNVRSMEAGKRNTALEKLQQTLEQVVIHTVRLDPPVLVSAPEPGSLQPNSRWTPSHYMKCGKYRLLIMGNRLTLAAVEKTLGVQHDNDEGWKDESTARDSMCILARCRWRMQVA